MSDPWLQLIDRLNKAELDLDDLQLAEIAWLSLQLPAPPPSRESSKTGGAPADQFAPPPAAGPIPDFAPQKVEPAPNTAGQNQTDEASLYANAPDSLGSVKATRVRVPGVAALPEAAAINRALRPFLRRAKSRRFQAIDEEETVTLSADARCILPVFSGEPERRFDAAIVVEEKPTMTVWRNTIREFQLLLERHGSFGDVRRFGFHLDPGAASDPIDAEARLASSSGANLPLKALNDSLSKRLIFFFTDGVSAGWASGAMARSLADWTARMPVVIVQLLSPGLWRLTPLGSPTAKVGALQPGAPNSLLEVYPPSWEENVERRIQRKEVFALPVVTLNPRHLAPWAKMLMAGQIDAPAFLLNVQAPDSSRPTQISSLEVGADLSPAERVDRFRQLVSPTARRLAGYLTIVPLHLPVMMMVQRLMLPDSQIEHLSEFLLGGLVRRAEVPDLPLEEGEVAFEFYDDEILDLLQEEVKGGELLRVLDELSRFVEREYGVTCDFKALIVDKKGTLLVPKKALPFARLADRARRKFGLAPRKKAAGELPADGDPTERELDELIERLAGEDALFAFAELVKRAPDRRLLAKLDRAIDEPRLVPQVVRILMKIGSDDASHLLRVRLLQTPGESGDLIIQTLGEARDPRAVDWLADYLKTKARFVEDSTVALAIGALEKIGGPLAASALAEFLSQRDVSDSLRLAAAEALTRMAGDVDLAAFPALIFSVRDSYEICLSVIRAYAEVGSGLNALRALQQRFAEDVIEPDYDSINPLLEQVIREYEFGGGRLKTHTFTVVKLDEVGKEVQRYARSAGYFEDDLGGDVTIKMVAIPGGEFLMGSPEGEGGNSERPEHRVTVPPFFMGMHTVTQAQWRAVAKMNRIGRDLKPDPSRFKGDDRPVECVSWDDAQEFCKRISIATGKAYRLPSEAEWEYACRAGTTTPFHFGPTVTPDFVNYNGKYPYGNAPKGVDREETTPVGFFKFANDFGLFDMHGNVWEWCQDNWRDNYDGPDRPDDGRAWMIESEKEEGLITRTINRLRGKEKDETRPGQIHLLRGGSWIGFSYFCRSACRFDYRFDLIFINIGCRVVVSTRTQ